jgi:hypothetical protein
LTGCSSSPARLEAPIVDPDAAGAKAVEQYDSNKDGSLGKGELSKCPGMLSVLPAYDADANGAVDATEITGRLKKLFKHGTGGTQLSCTVTRRGRPFAGAEVVFEPESYLGDHVMPAKGTTSNGGIAEMSIEPENLPERLRGFDVVHYGTFKVRITHPSVKLPAKYNTDTQLGYETRAGDPYVLFNLTE